jgi:hypothetical protein
MQNYGKTKLILSHSTSQAVIDCVSGSLKMLSCNDLEILEQRVRFHKKMRRDESRRIQASQTS